MKFPYSLTTWPDANLLAATQSRHTGTEKKAAYSFNTETIKAFRAKLNNSGISITQWSRSNNFNAHAVYRVINGYELGKKGKSLAIAQAMERFVGAGQHTDAQGH